MNRLVIIGNGFDLAHGIKSSYKDFVIDYLHKLITEIVETKNYEDALFKFKSKGPKIELKTPLGENFENLHQIINELIKHREITNNYLSSFFMDSLESIKNFNWVDFENLYFKHLLKKRDKQKNFSFDQVKKINEEFKFIKNKFEEYLFENSTPSKIINPNKYNYMIYDKIKKEDVLLKDLDSSKTPINIQILNFNYTYTTDSYLPRNNETNVSTNHIHGELKNPDNPIIFGFGDEHNFDYKEFETYENNILFEHIKSFKYLKTKNYYDLIRFINQDCFQVYILGHSCGLTDRTMLKEIFENEKCVSIKIFYWQKNPMKPEENDYTERTYEISRHFTDKGLMRKKIVPFPLSSPM